MKKRLLAISNHAVMLGGGEYSFLDLLSHLPPQWEVRSVVPEEGELALRLKAKGIPTVALPLPSLRPWHANRIIHALWKYSGTIKHYRPHLIYANGPRAVFYGGITGRFVGIPVIWHCRIADSDLFLDWLLSRLSNRIITNSHATARRFGPPVLKNKIAVIYNGIDLDWLRDKNIEKPPLIQPNWKIIIAVARASSSKRHDLVLAAFDQIAKEDDRCHLILIGSKDPCEPELWIKLQERSLHSPFSNRIHWVGHKDDVRPWYRSASLLILASENEAFGRVLVEAMACGLPVVATKSGGIPEIVRDGLDGFLVPPGKADELAKAALRILGNEPLRRQLSETAKKRAESFSLNIHVENMVKVFERTVRPKVEGLI